MFLTKPTQNQSQSFHKHLIDETQKLEPQQMMQQTHRPKSIAQTQKSVV